MDKKEQIPVTAQDGLSILVYLDLISGISNDEREFIRKKWNNPEFSLCNPITRIRELFIYSPIVYNKDAERTSAFNLIRKVIFDDRCKRSGIEERMAKGESIPGIISDSNHEFYILEYAFCGKYRLIRDNRYVFR